jgi:hypothetical protein
MSLAALLALALSTAPGAADDSTAVGLTLLPWQRETAAPLDRAATRYLPSLEILDPAAFARQVEHDEAVRRAVRERLAPR